MGRKGTWEIQGTICRYISSGLVDQPARKVQPLNQRIARASHGQGAFREKKNPHFRVGQLIWLDLRGACAHIHTSLLEAAKSIKQSR